MKKNEYTGWKDVFRFSLVQGIKAKAYYVSLIVMALIILIALPVIGFFQSREASVLGPTEVETLVVYDDSGLGLSVSSADLGDRYAGMTVICDAKETFEEASKRLEEAGKSAEVLMKIDGETVGLYQITFVKAASSAFSDDDYTALTGDVLSWFSDARLAAVELTAEQQAFLERPVEMGVETVQTNENGEIVISENMESDGISMEEYSVLLICIVGVMMIINLAGSTIATGIVTEKSTKVVEYLMINVRPMALVVGKILAALLLVILNLGSLALAFVLGKTISAKLFPVAEAAESTGTLTVFLNMLTDITAGRLLLAFAIILAGVLFFCILAGLAGASVSKMDEISEGMKTYQLLMVIGSYIGIGSCMIQMSGSISPVVLNIMCMIPISAPFVLPANLLLGKVGMAAGAIAFLLLLLLTAALFVFTSRVYESMIFYNGNVLKMKDILRIAKERNGGKKEARA